jgi:RNA polymerase sigma factor (sigma-70 family)
MDHHRLRRRVGELVERIGRRPPPAVGDSVERMTVWSVVDQLPMRQRQVMYLRYRADLTFEEIGLIMAITASGARAHAAKAKTSLRRSLDAEMVD